MSLLKGTLEKLATTGTLFREVPIGAAKFKLAVLSSEEQILADSIIRSKSLREKFGAAEDEISTLPDTLSKYRTLSILCFAVREIDCVKPIDETSNTEEQFKQRMEFRDELGKLNTAIIDKLMKEYWELAAEQANFFSDVVENAGK